KDVAELLTEELRVALRLLPEDRDRAEVVLLRDQGDLHGESLRLRVLQKLDELLPVARRDAAVGRDEGVERNEEVARRIAVRACRGGEQQRRRERGGEDDVSRAHRARAGRRRRALRPRRPGRA